MSTSERKALVAFRGLLEATSVPEAMAHVAAVASALPAPTWPRSSCGSTARRACGWSRATAVPRDWWARWSSTWAAASAARALERRAPVLSTEVEAHRAWPTDPLLEACALTSWIATPVVHAGEPIGALLVGRRDGPALGATEAALCSNIADLAVVAVDRLRAAAEGDRRRQETEALVAIRAGP